MNSEIVQGCAETSIRVQSNSPAVSTVDALEVPPSLRVFARIFIAWSHFAHVV